MTTPIPLETAAEQYGENVRNVARHFATLWDADAPDEHKLEALQYIGDYAELNPPAVLAVLPHHLACAVEAKFGETPEGYLTKLRTPSEITDADVLANNYIIKGWLDRRADAIAFGEWNIGKTFAVIDLLACVALGLPWFGVRVRKSRVLYLCYEGHAGIPKRIRALQQKYPGLNNAAFAWWPMRHALASEKGKTEFKEARRDFAERFNGVPDLVAIDPLRNALGGSDSDADKVELLRAETRALMEADGCAVLLVTHSGHSNKERARGDSGIVAGADAEIRIDGPERKGGPHAIVATKQRDSVKSTLHFRLRVVELGQDDDGDQVTTCTVEAAAAPEPEVIAPGPSVEERVEEAEGTILRLLAREIKAGVEHSADSLKRLRSLHGLPRDMADAAIARLEAKGRIEREPTGRKGGRAYKLAIKGGMPDEGAASIF